MNSRLGLHLLAAGIALLTAVACNSSEATNEGAAVLASNSAPSVKNDIATSAPPSPFTPPPNTFSAEERARITAGIRQLLLSRGYTPYNKPCADVFAFGQPRIVDTSLSGRQGRVQVIVPVTATRPDTERQRYGLGWPSDNCVGVGNETMWFTGRTMRVRFHAFVERWDSGWQLSANQSPRM